MIKLWPARFRFDVAADAAGVYVLRASLPTEAAGGAG
jgi:hypothetical protein